VSSKKRGHPLKGESMRMGSVLDLELIITKNMQFLKGRWFQNDFSNK